MELNQALLALERSAADASAALPDDLGDDVLLMLAAAWVPTAKGNRDQRLRQARQWVAWLRDCGSRWPSGTSPLRQARLDKANPDLAHDAPENNSGIGLGETDEHHHD